MTTSARRRWWVAGLAALVAVAGIVVGAGLLRHSPDRVVPLEQVTDFDAASPGIEMYVHVPAGLQAHPAVLVAIHYCGGSAQAFASRTDFADLADRYRFVVVYPSATRPGHCFDVSSPPAMLHEGGSDPTSIAHMVRWVHAHYGSDPARVFVTGLSSGAMETEVLLADYPDVFAAGAAFAGVPAGCFASDQPPPLDLRSADYSPRCAAGELTRTASQWGDVVRAAYPGWSGKRPRVQLWHGTADTTLAYANLGAAVAQWTDVLGVAATPASTDTPAPGRTRTRYGTTGDQATVEANSEDGVTHDIHVDAAAAVHFFGLDR
ncbi:extracellular catalytic domain type 1 short-chain-length polyhydroxyalkanoate depolymerase [Cellulomonas alba]|uniref:PHB depolymerase family esterase n=1 Tax=Cellulomonas alba TaxID=3053467 RepID=A0ABT7SFB8_9CELL|nr:PHB depolymerase family esterase [Cellulomonas alba]MDM7854219.1 PHB depolymerase family esterase [Cellulomonas alba]